MSAGVEARIVAVWRELFDDPGLVVASHDNFFTLGASSLLALRLAERLSAEFGVTVDLLVLIEDATPAALARYVEETLAAQSSLEAGEL
ncbi:phosphopantetheine-binding protein [Actinoplanes sp. NPDC049548]|uniref:phosphopantetheine-binding protein n=1 Tax=Actinoplanes sp. NPDC049548 TaxID=3155152 RepID=UPI003429E0FA